MDCYNVDKIIDEIEMQRYCMRARYNIEPNKIILGYKVYSVLLRTSNYFAEIKAIIMEDEIIDTIVGLPITIDYKNVDTIEVCFVLEEVTKSLERLMN